LKKGSWSHLQLRKGIDLKIDLRQGYLIKPFLAVSVLIHGAVLGGTSLISPPQFAVEQAPSNLEIVMLEQSKEVLPEKSEEMEPLAVVETATEDDVVFRKKQESRKEKKKEEPKKRKGKEEIQKTVIVFSAKGATSENKPKFLKNPAPIYPVVAKERGWQGRVILRVLVEKDGKPSQAVVESSSGYKILDESALKTIRKWQFQPARIGTVSVSSWIRIPVRFRLLKEKE
jgi:protein TonB